MCIFYGVPFLPVRDEEKNKSAPADNSSAKRDESRAAKKRKKSWLKIHAAIFRFHSESKM